MPPKTRYSREWIASAAFEIVRKRGMGELSARSVAKELGCSVAPVFSAFSNMEELQTEVKRRANALYSEYVKEGLAMTPAFKGVGTSYIKFAMREPELFELLFMSRKNYNGKDSVLIGIEENYEDILNSVMTGYGFDREDAKSLYLNMWIYTHGIAVLCVTGTCNFTAKEISAMLTEVCISLIKNFKGKSK